MVDGVYHMIYEELKPGIREKRHRRAVEQDALRDGLGRRRGDQRHFRRALQPASAQLHRPLFPARRPGVLRHPAVLPGLSDLLLPDVQHRPGDAVAERCLRQGARMDRRLDRNDQARRDAPTRWPRSGRRPRNSASPARTRPSACSSATGSALRCTSGRSSAARSRWITRWRSRPAWSSRWKPTVRQADGYSAARIEEEVVVTDTGCEVISALPGRRTADRQPLLSSSLRARFAQSAAGPERRPGTRK
jgi:hypothetical protein